MVSRTPHPHPALGHTPTADHSQEAVQPREMGRILPFRWRFETNSHSATTASRAFTRTATRGGRRISSSSSSAGSVVQIIST